MRRIVGLTLLILAILGTANYVSKMATQSEPKLTGNAAYDAGQKTGRAAVPVVLAVMAVLGFRLLFSSSDYEPVRAPARRAPVRGAPSIDPSLRGSQDTFASNPAMLRISGGSWLAANPAVPIASCTLAVIGFVVLFIKLPLGIVLIVTAGIVLFRQISEGKQKFYRGDVCPGVVLSAQKNLVAVFTDLKAASRTPQPAIKILKQPLRLMTPEPACDGMRVAAVALYHGDGRRPAWKNFTPDVIDCVVRDPQEIARVLGSIRESEWQTLDTYLARVPVDRPGLYRLSAVTFAPAGQTPGVADDAIEWTPPKPWYKTTPAIIGFSILGGVATVILLLNSASAFFNSGARYHGPTHRPVPGTASTVPPAPNPPGWGLTATGPYRVGANVQAQWGAGWVQGRITSINPGGFSVMVQLQDPRFRNPIVFGTNQIRLR